MRYENKVKEELAESYLHLIRAKEIHKNGFNNEFYKEQKENQHQFLIENNSSDELLKIILNELQHFMTYESLKVIPENSSKKKTLEELKNDVKDIPIEYENEHIEISKGFVNNYWNR